MRRKTLAAQSGPLTHLILALIGACVSPSLGRFMVAEHFYSTSSRRKCTRNVELRSVLVASKQPSLRRKWREQQYAKVRKYDEAGVMDGHRNMSGLSGGQTGKVDTDIVWVSGLHAPRLVGNNCSAGYYRDKYHLA